MINDIYRSILKTLVLEMAVQEFSAPDGPSAKLLKLSNQFGHGLTVEQVTEPPLIEHQQNHSAPARKFGEKVYDSWPMSKWREILLSFMRDNGGFIVLKDWAAQNYKPEEHNGISYGFSRIHAAITDMNLRLGLVRLVSKGKYELTEKGWDLLRQQAETVEIEDIPVLEASANGDYPPNLTVGQHLIEFLRRNGDWTSKKYAPAYEAYFHKSAIAKNGTIFGAMGQLVAKKLAKKVGIGHYIVTAKAKKATA